MFSPFLKHGEHKSLDIEKNHTEFLAVSMANTCENTTERNPGKESSF